MGKKEDVAAGSPRHSLRRRQDPQFRGCGYRSSPAVVVFIPHCRFMQRVLSLGFFCVERIPWDAPEAEVEAGSGDPLEHLLQRFIQHGGNAAGMQTYLSNYCRSLLGNESSFLHCPSMIPSPTCCGHVEKPLSPNLEGRAGAGAPGGLLGAAPQLTHFNCSR